MKIDSSVKSVGGLSNSEPGVRSVKDQPASPARGADASVEVSSLSSRLREMSATLASVPVVDSAHVAEIKQAIVEGRFHVNAEKVADSLIESVKDMLAAQSRKA